MLKFHPIIVCMKMHANFQKIFRLGLCGLNIYFQFIYKIRNLDLMLLLKNSVPFEGLYYSKYISYASGDFNGFSLLVSACFMLSWQPEFQSNQPKISKGANIWNRYNQEPHLTQDTNGKVTIS